MTAATITPVHDDDPPPASGDPASRSELAFLFDLGSARLRARARWGAIVLLAMILMPYDVVLGRAQFPWELLAELPPAGVVAALAGEPRKRW